MHRQGDHFRLQWLLAWFLECFPEEGHNTRIIFHYGTIERIKKETTNSCSAKRKTSSRYDPTPALHNTSTIFSQLRYLLDIKQLRHETKNQNSPQESTQKVYESKLIVGTQNKTLAVGVLYTPNPNPHKIAKRWCNELGFLL